MIIQRLIQVSFPFFLGYVYMATMEEGKAGEESTYFDNIENTRADRPYNYPDKNPANAKLAKVPGKSRGPSIMLKVMAGDTV